METNGRGLAVITGASGGLGLDLARQCAQNKYDLIIAANEVSILDAAEELSCSGVSVSPVQCDLSSLEGVDALRDAITASGRPADILVANAGREVLDCTVNERLIDARAYIEGTIYLVDQVSRSMRGRGQGRILITYSIGGLVSVTSQPAHDRNQAFLDFFAKALCRELKHTGVTVTCLAPGRTESNLFDGAATTGHEAIIAGGRAFKRRLALAELPSAALASATVRRQTLLTPRN
jgi:short-subunit dehydrogenase